MNYFITTKPTPYALDDTLNYNYVLSKPLGECFKTYIEIINAYMIQYKRIQTPNNTLYTYLLDKGICTINHIFRLMLLYTKNLDLTNHYCRQTIGYYVEFIEQNMQHEDKDIINYNNASRFSYSKTIDKLIKYYRKTSYNELDDHSAELLSVVEEKEADLYSVLNMLMEVYSKLVEVGANEVGANAVGANAVGANAKTDVITLHLLNLITNELHLREKLHGLLAFINNFPVKDETGLIYIYCLCKHLEYELPTKNSIIKKLSTAENKIRLQKDLVEAYICWIMV